MVPILLHGCEVWCPMMTNLASKLQLRFYKIILKLDKSAPTCMVYGELGQFPLELQAKTRMLKLWFKLVNINCKHKFSNSMYTFLYDVYHAGIYKSTFLSNVENFKWDRPKRYVDKPVLLEYFQSKVQVWSYTNFKGPIYPKLAVRDYLKVNLLQLQNV